MSPVKFWYVKKRGTFETSVPLFSKKDIYSALKKKIGKHDVWCMTAAMSTNNERSVKLVLAESRVHRDHEMTRLEMVQSARNTQEQVAEPRKWNQTAHRWSEFKDNFDVT